MSKFKKTKKTTSEILPQTIFSDPVLNKTFKGNTNTINSCIFNPNMYLKIILILLIFIGNKLSQGVKMEIFLYGILPRNQGHTSSLGIKEVLMKLPLIH